MAKAPRRRLTESSRLVLATMAANGGTARVTHGVRYRYASRDFVALMSGALHTLVAEDLITAKHQNEAGRYRWTAKGYEALQRGSYEASQLGPHWLRPSPEPFYEARDGDTP